MLGTGAGTEMNRRNFLRSAAAAVGAVALAGGAQPLLSEGTGHAGDSALEEFGYGDVSLAPGMEETQLRETHAVLMGLSDDDLLKPFRVRAGMSAPGADLGGWYDAYGYAPGHTFGQWMSALSRYSAITGDEATRAKVDRMVRGYASVPNKTGAFFENNRFPAYTLEKLNCGFIDAHSFARNGEALEVMRAMTFAVLPHLPEKALSRAEQAARPHKDVTYTYDEAYTLPENYFLAWQRSGDPLYRDLAVRFLHNDGFLTELSQGKNVLPGLHAFSHLNALNSAAQAYLALGDEKYLRAATNGFGFIQEQSYATGGWGPDEAFVTPGRGELAKSLEKTHSSFETPCGAYGHIKLTRNLLRATRDARYGDSMEAVLLNTVLGSKPLAADGSAFYYSDYSFTGKKVFAKDKWPCCSGTLPQVAADYRISSYLRGAEGVWVTLYVPSTLRWQTDGGRAVTVSQTGNYPVDGLVKLRVKSDRRHQFALALRIPGWAGEDARITVNGERYHGPAKGGSFASMSRVWGKDDRVEISFPMKLRLQAVDPETPGTVALMRGPLALFRVGGSDGTLHERNLLGARQVSDSDWIVSSAAGDVHFRPFPAIHDESYSLYTHLA